MTKVAIASCAGMPEGFADDELLAGELSARGIEASILAWDDREVDWDRFDHIVIRSTWDYSPRREQFVAWAESIGERLHNPVALIRWNSDKHYMSDLAVAGISVVKTWFVRPGGALPELNGEIVIKPTVSAGGRDTGRFRSGDPGAVSLLEAIHDGGRVAMVQPYESSVDTAGERAVVTIDGEFSHALRKGRVLRPDEVAPVRESDTGAAEVMYDPGLVTASEADDDEIELALRVVAHVQERFATRPLYARIDIVRNRDGAPMVLELEAIEPCLYLEQADGAAGRLAAAIERRVSEPRPRETVAMRKEPRGDLG